MVEIPAEEVEDLIRALERLRTSLERRVAPARRFPPTPPVELPPGFTVGQRILVHLLRSGGADSGITELTAPRALTQGPIAEAVGVTRPHASLELKRLAARGLVESPGKRHPVPDGIARAVYKLTPRGHAIAKEVRVRAKV